MLGSKRQPRRWRAHGWACIALLPMASVVAQVPDTAVQEQLRQQARERALREQQEAIPDGKIYVFNNGIFNDEEGALHYGSLQSGDMANEEGVYHILNPKTGNPVAEILYAGYDKLNDLLGGALPLTQAEKTNQVILDIAKEQGGVVQSVNHSRGGLTWINAIGNLKQQDKHNVAIGDVYFFGAAANAQEAADIAWGLSTGTPNQYQATHPTDLVARVSWILGGNPATGAKNEGGFPDSHRWYTQSLFPEGVSLRGVNVRESTDRNWGPANFSVPKSVPPSEKAKSGLKKQGGGE